MLRQSRKNGIHRFRRDRGSTGEVLSCFSGPITLQTEHKNEKVTVKYYGLNSSWQPLFPFILITTFCKPNESDIQGSEEFTKSVKMVCSKKRLCLDLGRF